MPTPVSVTERTTYPPGASPRVALAPSRISSAVSKVSAPPSGIASRALIARFSTEEVVEVVRDPAGEEAHRLELLGLTLCLLGALLLAMGDLELRGAGGDLAAERLGEAPHPIREQSREDRDEQRANAQGPRTRPRGPPRRGRHGEPPCLPGDRHELPVRLPRAHRLRRPALRDDEHRPADPLRRRRRRTSSGDSRRRASARRRA